ncbi:hypothetical protein FGG08_002223 [Glutinoglossum americanum]|uniref:Major facilitator superfamily (MFS) profile domain-containing protein n=1 Tax=Glutinoglossum americanum TaxID=1670608 RepID=A0A9P8L5R9_9PEZI|nr:hypothetical protein FGG08_002223 [Glutinoglossum americanum]
MEISYAELDMTFQGEHTPLLTATSSDTGADEGGSDGRLDNESLCSNLSIDADEEPLDLLLARFGSPVAPLGLDGGIPGAPLVRRGRVPHNSARIRWKPSHSSFIDGAESARRRSISPVISYTSRLSNRSNLVDDDTGDGSKPDQKSRFLGGVSDAQFWAIFFGVLLVVFVACFDSTLMASSHPVVTSYFQSSNAASWLSTSFLLTSTAFQPIFGRISDTIGRKPPYLFTLVVFAIGTVWCGSAQSIFSFIMARAACGLGAGGAMAMGSIINTDLVPMKIRGTYQAYLNLAYGIGCSLGAAMGGFLADALGWRWEFWIQVPAITLCLMVAALTTPDDLGPQLAKRSGTSLWQTMKGFDLAGSFLLTTSVTFLILALNLGGNVLPWADSRIITAFIISGITGSVLIAVEKRADKPVLPLKILFSNPRGNLVFSNFFASMTMNTVLFNVPLYFQAVLLDSATRSGTRLVLPFLLSMIAGVSTGLIITWSTRMKPTLMLGYALLLIGSILLAIMKGGLPTWVYNWIIAPACLGQGFAFPSTTMAMLVTSHQEDMAVAISTLMLWRSLGTVMGVAISSLIMQNTLLLFLTQFVTGPDREEVITWNRCKDFGRTSTDFWRCRQVISKARKSVEAITHLSKRYQGQVIDAYSASLQLAFISAIVTTAIAILLVLYIDIPRLSDRHETVAADD